MRFSLFLCGLVMLAGAIDVHAADASGGLTVTRLRCEALANPQGIDDGRPRLSWIVESPQRGQRQIAYRILVASDEANLKADIGDLWDTDRMGRDDADQSTEIVYAGKPLTSRSRCYWKVKAWDKFGQASDWSPVACWTIGLRSPKDWSAQWISFKDASPLPADVAPLHLPPAHQYRKEFTAAKEIKHATVYASALGLYELHLNGKCVSDAYFTPGWADYRKRDYYNTYDVTNLLTSGPNAIGAIVADGWYSGYVGYGYMVGNGPNKGGRFFYGKTPALLVQLEIEYADGSHETVATDPTWKVSGDGPIREADLIMGESYDARLERPDWCTAGFKADRWQDAIAAEANGSTKATFIDNGGERQVELGFQKPAVLQAHTAPPVRVTQEIKPISVTENKPGVFIYDMGQNFAGNIRLSVKGPAGTQVKIRYGEMLHPDGRLMTENLRKARSTDYYTLRGSEAGETWSPRFTYHGFRYVELTGLPAAPGIEAVTGLVIGSDTPLTSKFECSDATMNRFFKNVVWTQRANFMEVPTDCPQRDERLGWMGDAQIYVRTATINADVEAFYDKWIDDVREAQRDTGAYPDYCPYHMNHGMHKQPFATAWMDAGVICPWTIWKVYGDKRIIERHYASMQKFIEFRKKSSPDCKGVSIGSTYGDWLNVNEPTPIEYIDACYFARSTALVAEMADAIGKTADGEEYRKLLEAIKAEFARDYVQPDGALTVNTQTAYVLALEFDLLPNNLKKPAADHLAGMIEKNGFRMSTGFLGTKPLLPVLSAAGHHDLAVRLFQSRLFPSWGYEVENGATTVWERWDGYTKEHGFEGLSGHNNASMNSYSHYSFGAVCEWMFRTLAGIDEQGEGFQHLIIRPGPPSPGSNPDRKPIDHVKAEYDSPHGLIRSEWTRSAGKLELNVTIPANADALIDLPAAKVTDVSEGGKPLAASQDFQIVGETGGHVLLKIGSGSYAFVSKLDETRAQPAQRADSSNDDGVSKIISSAIAERSIVSMGDASRLQRVLAKARRGEAVTIAVIGGSITQGAKASKYDKNYGSVLAQWWRQTFPNARIELVNAGIGATGSNYGALRARRDLLSHKPDFVVMEYAVNDASNPDCIETLEGLVRQTLKEPQQPAVVLLFMMHTGGGNAQEQHAQVGQHYHLPMVSFRDAFWPEVQSKRLKWEDIIADQVHPNDRGHAAAAMCVANLLQKVLDALPADGKLPEIGPIALPLVSDSFEHVNLLEADALQPVKNDGWTFDAKTKSWKSDKPGARVEFEVEGQMLLLMDWRLRGPMGKAKVQLDDRPAIVREAWFNQTWGGYRQTTELARGLSPGKHYVTIEILPDKNPESTGHEYRLLGLGCVGLAR